MSPIAQPPHVSIAALLRWVGHHLSDRRRPAPAAPQPARLTVHRS